MLEYLDGEMENNFVLRRSIAKNLQDFVVWTIFYVLPH